jgi:integrase
MSYAGKGQEKRLGLKDIKTAWHNTLDEAGVRYRKFHDLRHTTATMLFAKKTDPATVSKILGYSNVNTTFKFYAAVLDEGKRAALDSAFKTIGEQIV